MQRGTMMWSVNKPEWDCSGKFRLFLLGIVMPMIWTTCTFRIQYSCSPQALIDALVRTANLQTVLERRFSSSNALRTGYEASFVRNHTILPIQ